MSILPFPVLLVPLVPAAWARCPRPGRAGPARPGRVQRSGRAEASQGGQATTEYALVLLGAAAVALLLVAWATRTGALGSLLDAVLDSIKKKV